METLDVGEIDTVDFPYFTKSTVSEEKFEEYKNIVKRHIMNYGGLYCVVASPNSGKIYFNPNTSAECYLGNFEDLSKGDRKTHAVTVIGWDDSYSKENFNEERRPENDGAYICLNSWGEKWGDNGYFYVSYEDESVNKQLSGITEVNEGGELMKLSDFGNPALESAIKDELNVRTIDNEDYVDKNVVEEITYLNLSGKNITNLKGIEKFNNLRNISLSDNNIKDITPLKECKELEYIDLKNNQIKDVFELESLEKLSSLDLYGNLDVKGYEECSNLKYLNLSYCDIQSVGQVNKLNNLNGLYLDGNKGIVDIEKLELKNIICLSISDCGISELGWLNDNDSAFEYLDLSNNGYVNLSTLDSEIKIYNLNLNGNTDIKDFRQLNEISIVSLDVSNCNIEDIAILPIENENITELNLSNNSITNNLGKLKEMKNLEYLYLNSCNLEDITELNGVECSYIALDENRKVHGNLDKANVYEVSLRNCELDKNFDFFGSTNIQSYNLFGNNVDLSKIKPEDDIVIIKLGMITKNQYDFSNVNQKVEVYASMQETTISDLEYNEIPENVHLSRAIIEKDFIIPEGKTVYLYTMDLNIRLEKVDDIKVDAYIPIKIDITNAKTLELNGGSEYNWNQVVYSVKKSDSMKPTELRVVKMPHIINVLSDETFKDLAVEENYTNGVYAAVENPDIWYDKDNVIEGKNLIKVSADGLEKNFYIFVSKDNKYVTLKFEDEVLYNKTLQVANYEAQANNIEGVISDDDAKTLKLTKKLADKLESYGSVQSIFKIPYDSLYDIKALKGLDMKGITVEFFEGSNEDSKITEDDLEKLEIFVNIESIAIVDNNVNKFKADRIVNQDKYMVDYLNGGYRSKQKQLESFSFDDERLYRAIKEKNDNLYMDYETMLFVGLTKEQVTQIENEGLTIPYESLYNVESLSKLNLQSLTIEFSAESEANARITEEDLQLLESFNNLNTVYIIDSTNSRAKEDLIVDQDRYTVYINGEIYQERVENDENEYTNRIDINDSDYNNIIYD